MTKGRANIIFQNMILLSTRIIRCLVCISTITRSTKEITALLIWDIKDCEREYKRQATSVNMIVSYISAECEVHIQVFAKFNALKYTINRSNLIFHLKIFNTKLSSPVFHNTEHRKLADYSPGYQVPLKCSNYHI